MLGHCLRSYTVTGEKSDSYKGSKIIIHRMTQVKIRIQIAPSYFNIPDKFIHVKKLNSKCKGNRNLITMPSSLRVQVALPISYIVCRKDEAHHWQSKQEQMKPPLI